MMDDLSERAMLATPATMPLSAGTAARGNERCIGAQFGNALRPFLIVFSTCLFENKLAVLQ